MYDGEIRIDTRIDTSGIDKGVSEVQGKLTRSIKGLSSLVKGAGFAAAFAAISKGIGQIAENTAKLENSLRAASTLFGDVSVDMDGLRDKIRKLSSETGIAADAIGDALYEALSSGVPVTEDMGEAMEFLRSSADAAKGGFADLTQTVTATAAVINAYGLSVSDAERVQGVLIQTQNKGMTTIGKLATGLARVIPTAASFGVSLEQIGAALSTTTAAGTQTDEAITGLNSLLSELGKQGQTGAEGLADATEAAGMGRKSFQQLTAEGYDLSDILGIMEEYAEKSGKTLIDMFGSIEAGRTALQLAGANAEKFAENLEAMYNTEGLTARAAETVTTNVERLGTAIRNAGSTIGRNFEPTVQSVAGGLADMVNAMFGNRDEAGRLETALDNVKTALEKYKKAQEDAKTATDETTIAMAEMSQEAFSKAIIELGYALEDAEKAYLKNEDRIATSNSIIEEMETNLDNLAKQAGLTRDEMDHLGRSGRLDKRFTSEWESYTSELEHHQERVKVLSGDYEELKNQMNVALQAAAEMYSEGFTDIVDSFAVSNTEAANTVQRLARAYSAGEAKAAEYGEITLDNLDATEEYIKTLEDEQKEVEIGTSKYSALKGEIDALTEAYNKLAKATGRPLLGGSATSQTTSSASSSPAQSATPSINTENLRTAADVIDEITKAFDDNATKAKIFGDSFNEAEANVNAITAGINELIEDFNLDPASAEAEAFINLLGKWQEEAGKTGDSMTDMAAQLEAWAESAATSFAQSIGTGIENLITDFMTIDEQVAELNEQLGDAQAEQLERNQELAEAEEEYRLALLEGNEEQIASALESLEAAKETKKAQDEKVKSLKDEIEATKDGSKAWESFGKSALLALADVLEGLGAQLAAQAVLQAVEFNWANAAIATAGSVAAYIAAGLVRGWAGSYAEGGIVPQVPGVPSTGDQHVARVNPGELILNEAQQENIATLLSAQRAMLEYEASESGGSQRQLIVEISGDVYGLDSEEVGKAIYRNIKGLQEEGRINRW